MPKEKFDALAEAQGSPLFSELERLVLRYAEEMTGSVQIDAGLVEALKRHRSPAALVQLTLSVAAANFTTASTRRSVPSWSASDDDARARVRHVGGDQEKLGEVRRGSVARAARYSRRRKRWPWYERTAPSRTIDSTTALPSTVSPSLYLRPLMKTIRSAGASE